MLLAQGEETINQDELIEKCKYLAIRRMLCSKQASGGWSYDRDTKRLQFSHQIL